MMYFSKQQLTLGPDVHVLLEEALLRRVLERERALHLRRLFQRRAELGDGAAADVSFVEEVEGVALGLLPLAGIAAIVGGGAIAKLGPSLEKAGKMKRTLALEYSAQKRFTKMDKLDIKA